MTTMRPQTSFIVAIALCFIITILFHAATAANNGVKFSKLQLEGSIIDVQYLSKQVVVVLTDESFYLSTDGGITFHNQNAYLCEKKSCVSRMVPNPTDEHSIVLIGSSTTTSSSSTNGGGDGAQQQVVMVEHYISNNLLEPSASLRYYKFRFPVAASSFQILPHPSYRKHYLALINVAGTTSTTTGTSQQQQQQQVLNNLYVSRDGCRSWYLVKDNIRQALWSNKSGGKHNGDKILAIKVVPAADYKALFSYDIVTKSTSDDIVTGANDIFHIGQYTFLSTRINDGSSSGYGLYVSVDNGAQFRRVQLPDSEAHKKSYVLLDNAQGSVFLNVVEKDKSLGTAMPFGTVYVSDWSGSRYSHSLVNNHVIHPSAGQNKADFHRIKALEGVYISNVITNPKEELCAKCATDCHKTCKISSRISFNRGVLWQELDAPSVDSVGSMVKCTKPPCRLQLRGIQVATTSPIHSDESAVGLIMATGNVGSRLSTKGSSNTYLSRDAGVTWTEVAKGSHTYEVTDNGALIVMAKDGQPVDSISYSWNQGAEWETAKFSNESISIERITYNQKDPNTKIVLLQGYQGDSSILISADFGAINIRDCAGFDKPGTADSDYEYFIPRTYQNEQCLLGKIVQYERKKKAVKCFNKFADKPEKIRNCQCTLDDYECDYYYVRKFNGDKMECVPSDAPEARDQIEKLKFPPSRCYGHYNETRGYRKVAGNSCQDGLDLSPIPKQCPSAVSSLGVIILIVFFTVLFGFGALFLYRNSTQFQSMVRSASRYTSQSVVHYTQMSDHSEFGLDDTDEDEPDEIDSTFNFSAVSSLRMANQPINDQENQQQQEEEDHPIDQSNARTVSLDADPLSPSNRRDF